MRRIQRKRTKGWKMPLNAVYVGRPSKWGNPYYEGKEGSTLYCLAKYEELLDLQLKQDPTFLNPLKGKDLACWCPLDKPCHADVLLRFLERLEREKA